MPLNDQIVAKQELTRLLKLSLQKKIVFATALTAAGTPEALLLPRETGTLAEAALLLKKRASEEGIRLSEPSLLLGRFALKDDDSQPNVYRMIVAKKPGDALTRALAALVKPARVVLVVEKRKAKMDEAINLRFVSSLVMERAGGGLELEPAGYERLHPLLEKIESVLDGSWTIEVDQAEALERKLIARVDELLKQQKAELRELGEQKGDNVAYQKKNLATGIKRVESYRRKLQGRVGVSLRAVFDDPNVDRVRGHLSLREAMRVKAAGVPFGEIDFDTFKDQDLDPKNPPRVVGVGGFNAPVVLTYTNGSKRVFKEEQDHIGATSRPSSDILGLGRESPHFGNRNVVSSKIARALGTNCIPKVTYGVHEGKVGILMQFADGVEASKLAKDMPRMNATQVASLLKGLYELEWTDALTGQVDRHWGNYLVKVNPGGVVVTGIDNDLCLGPKDKEVDIKNVVNTTPNLDLVGLAVARRINELDFDTELRPGMVGRLTGDEIEAAAGRFFSAKKRVGELAKAGCVVDNWVTWRKDVKGRKLDAAQYLISLERSTRNSLFASLVEPLVNNNSIEK